MGALLLGAPLLSATAGASTVGLLGAGGVFAPAAGSLFGSLGTLSTIASIGSSLFKSQAQQKEYSGQIAASNYNASINKQNAKIAAQQGAAKEVLDRRENYIRLGKATADAGANSTGFGGSTADILSDTASQNELNILNDKYQTSLQVRQYNSDANLDLLSAKTTKKVAKLSRGAAVLSGTAKLGANSVV